MASIRELKALEVLDSRGRPTVWASCALESGAAGEASVPSGASTGSAEALELRDGDPKRYRGQGCHNAVANIVGPILEGLRGRSFESQAQLDQALVALDGTPNKARLGANATLAVSLAFAHAHAAERRVPLYQHFADMIGAPLRTLPRLTVNLFSGGKHAGAQVPVQDVLVVPMAATSIEQSLAIVYEVYQAAAELCHRKYNMRLLTADEGGLAPNFPSIDVMFDDAVTAIRAAGFEPGRDVALAVDVAASHFFRDGRYHLSPSTHLRSAEMMLELFDWLERYPIVSLEDGLAEEDWPHWIVLTHALEGRVLIVGDDFLCTHPQRIARAVEKKAASAMLLKVNQIGTLTEAAESMALARGAGWSIIASARSGETEAHWLADLAVGWGAEQIKVGSITQSERLAKYNRLLAIETATKLPVAPWPRQAQVTS